MKCYIDIDHNAGKPLLVEAVSEDSQVQNYADLPEDWIKKHQQLRAQVADLEQKIIRVAKRQGAW